MFKIELAKLTVQLDNRYPLIQDRCQSYLAPDTVPPQITVPMQTDEYLHEIQQYAERVFGKHMTLEETEFDRLHYLIYPSLVQYQAFWLHACVVELDGEGYAFSAPPGTGKTTHALQWLQTFPGKAEIINGDNPIVRELNGQFYAFGTPFCGKEGYHQNRAVPLKGLGFLTRAEKNRLEPMDPAIAMMRLYWDNWTIPKNDPEAVDCHLALYGRFVEQVPVYRLYMNNFKPDAALVACAGMRCEKEKKS